MPNIAMNNYCNLSCPYCFADSFLADSQKENITPDQIIKIFDFLETSNKSIGRVGLIGGEPTLHPQINDIINIAKEFAIRCNSRVCIFSNGIYLNNIINKIDSQCTVLINLNEPKIIGQKNWEKILINLNRIKALNLTQNVELGINIYPDIRDLEYIFKAAKMIYAKTIRCSYVAPSKLYSTSNKDEYYTHAKNIFLKVCQIANDYNIKLGLDCNRIPTCYFTNAELEFIKSVINIKQKDKDDLINQICYPVIDITPDFHATSCFGTYELVDLNDFETYDELEEYFSKQILDPLKEKNTANDKCQECDCFKNKTCQGGCLGFAKNNLL